jgi:hypothetical protein
VGASQFTGHGVDDAVHALKGERAQQNFVHIGQNQCPSVSTPRIFLPQDTADYLATRAKELKKLLDKDI